MYVDCERTGPHSHTSINLPNATNNGLTAPHYHTWGLLELNWRQGRHHSEAETTSIVLRGRCVFSLLTSGYDDDDDWSSERIVVVSVSHAPVYGRNGVAMGDALARVALVEVRVQVVLAQPLRDNVVVLGVVAPPVGVARLHEVAQAEVAIRRDARTLVALGVMVAGGGRDGLISDRPRRQGDGVDQARPLEIVGQLGRLELHPHVGQDRLGRSLDLRREARRGGQHLGRLPQGGRRGRPQSAGCELVESVIVSEAEAGSVVLEAVVVLVQAAGGVGIVARREADAPLVAAEGVGPDVPGGALGRDGHGGHGHHAAAAPHAGPRRAAAPADAAAVVDISLLRVVGPPVGPICVDALE